MHVLFVLILEISLLAILNRDSEGGLFSAVHVLAYNYCNQDYSC